MADIATGITKAKSGKPMRKQLSTRIDLTPMVDLGFLLITFFIFTTTLQQPSVMKLNLPKGEIKDMPIAESKTLNLILGKNNTIGYYIGTNVDAMKLTDYSATGLRVEIEKEQNRVADRFGNKSQLFTVIKPTSESSYKNVVDVLDEMLINNVTLYVLTEAEKKEVEKLGKE